MLNAIAMKKPTRTEITTPSQASRRDHGHPQSPSDLTHHFNEVTRSRKPSAMKGLYKYFLVPGMSNLAGGLPYTGYFPYDKFNADVASPSRLLDTAYHGISKKPASFFSFGAKKPSPSGNITIPKYEPSASPLDRIDLDTTLQYGRATGLPALASFIREFTFEHLLQGSLAYPTEKADILLTCGSTDGFSKIIGLLGSSGDNMLVEEFSYPNAIQSAQPFGINTAPVKMDAGGMKVDGKGGLKDVLENWDTKKHGRRPHLMYTVTIGHNPTGATLRRDRRREIYALCDKYDVIIIEDDPYWHLQYTDSSHKLPKDGKYPFLAALEPSFLTMDTSGRVVRLDTFSKTIAPGCRLGWITAQAPFIEALIAQTEGSTQQPSGFVQAMVAELLCRNWGMDGWVQWLEALRGVYEERMKVMCRVLEKGTELVTSREEGEIEVVTKSKLYSFTPPDGGMFIWVHIAITSHPVYTEFLRRGNTKSEMVEKLWDYVALTQMSLPSPGLIFAGDDRCKDDAAEYMRFCFAAIEIDEIDGATERWVVGIKEFWGLSAAEIEKIGEDEGAVRAEEVWGAKVTRSQEGGWGGFRGGKGRLEVPFEG